MNWSFIKPLQLTYNAVYFFVCGVMIKIILIAINNINVNFDQTTIILIFKQKPWKN